MNINERKSAEMICVKTDAFLSWHDTSFYFQWPFVCAYYSVSPFLMIPSDLRMNIMICISEKEKGKLRRWRESFVYYIIIIVVAFTVIIMMLHMLLCTCHMLGIISLMKNKCGRDCEAGLPIEKRTEGLRDRESWRGTSWVFIVPEPTTQKHLNIHRPSSADLIFMATSYCDRFSCSQYPWL